MAQRQKANVRQAILAAAAEELARVGLEKTTLAAVAEKAGTSVGNVYKYFPNKGVLFASVISPALVRDFRRRLRRRIEALGVEVNAETLAPDHPYRTAAQELLDFALVHRYELLFLLRRAEDTIYASFPERLAHTLALLARRYAVRAYPAAQFGPGRRRALLRIYRAFVASIASLLAEEMTAAALTEATRHLTTYHLAGLRTFFEAAERRT